MVVSSIYYNYGWCVVYLPLLVTCSQWWKKNSPKQKFSMKQTESTKQIRINWIKQIYSDSNIIFSGLKQFANEAWLQYGVTKSDDVRSWNKADEEKGNIENINWFFFIITSIRSLLKYNFYYSYSSRFSVVYVI